MSIEQTIQQNTAAMEALTGALQAHGAILQAVIAASGLAKQELSGAAGAAPQGAASNKMNPAPAKTTAPAQKADAGKPASPAKPAAPAKPPAPQLDAKALRQEAGEMVLKLVDTHKMRPQVVEALQKYGASKLKDVTDDKIGGLHSLLAKRLREAEAAASAPASQEPDDLDLMGEDQAAASTDDDPLAALDADVSDDISDLDLD